MRSRRIYFFGICLVLEVGISKTELLIRSHDLGLHVSNRQQWDDYLKEYGTGHFDKTFLICDATEGINQMELYFLRHLIHNQRLVSNDNQLLSLS